MKKYWNALLYGNAKTKRILWSIIVLFLCMIAFTVIGAAGGGMIWYLFAVFALIMNIVLMESVRLGDVTHKVMDEKSNTKNRAAIKNIRFDSLSAISEEDIAQLMVAYKVNKAHVPVMIDSYEKENVIQSPAFLWEERGYAQLLVLEEKPRNLAIPLSEISEFDYEKDVRVTPSKEYSAFRQPSVVSVMFQQLLPSYKERQQSDGRRIYTKNLYTAKCGIRFTNTSMRNVTKTLHAIISFDSVLDDRYSEYYREAYRMKFLLMDQILEANEYKEKISTILKNMAEQCEEDSVFCEELERMVRVRMVTREVAEYFMDYHQKQKRRSDK